jgi:hypothetical protein
MENKNEEINNGVNKDEKFHGWTFLDAQGNVHGILPSGYEMMTLLISHKDPNK